MTATQPPDLSTLPLHDALPICRPRSGWPRSRRAARIRRTTTSDCGTSENATTTATPASYSAPGSARSEEHTSELQSHVNLVCRLLLEKKKKKKNKSKYKCQNTQ